MAGVVLVSGYPPGYLDKHSGNKLIATSVAFTVIETVLMGIHVYPRQIQHTSRSIDDFLTGPAYANNVAICVSAIVLVSAGVWHSPRSRLAAHAREMSSWARGIYADVWLWILSTALPRPVIISFYRRFFTLRWERVRTKVVMAITVEHFLATGLATTFQCSPVAFQWDKSIPNGTCFDTLAFYRWMSFPNIMSDAVMLALPWPMIWRLHTTLAQKWGLVAIFLTGGVGLVSSSIRFAIFYHYDASEDNTWTSVQLLKWTDIEPSI